MRLRFISMLAAGSVAWGCFADVSGLSSGRALVTAGAGGGAGAAGANSEPQAGGGSGGRSTQAGGAGFAGQGGSLNTAGASAVCVPEICNGKDDDCDSIVDEGCPVGLLRGSTTAQLALGDSTGGTPFEDICGNDEVVVGLQLAFGDSLDQVTAICQKYALKVDRSVAPYRYSVELSPGTVLPAHPTTTSDALQVLSCAAGSVMVGLSVDQQNSGEAPDAFIVITRVAATCAAPVLALDGTSARLVWQKPVTVGPIAGAGFAIEQASNRSDQLSNEQLSVGFRGASGAWVDQVGMTSSAVQVLLN